ncbi:AAA family ATPase [Polyangium sp. 15x6]|uniref:AAA family ATPase n=1 Tax=Polyangium sp. 15x6 TaxID=3042687 RepID=UPI00249B29BD|nr:AAA family ATPase [Polyangium sp. 15x6]MDI3288365.1 hypothetical protein [Polyangium sp. 15x6]
MDGGIHALKGFIYQATVILDVLLPHFAAHPGARARPEGADDLVLEWSENGRQRCEYIQIKKPSEDDSGHLKLEPWNLRKVTQTLLPDAIVHLRGNEHVQRWILGDDVEPEVRALVDAGLDAPTLALHAYLHTVHLLAREDSSVTAELSPKGRQSVGQWRFDPEPGATPEDALGKMVAAFGARVGPLGATAEKIQRYEELVREHHRDLPELLSRIRTRSTFGRDDEVRARVCVELAQTYPISRERIVDTVFGNMRMFVDDVAVRRGTWIDRDALDALVARVWPEMMPLREPPPLPVPYIERQELVDKILSAMPCRALEVVGVAGSGKTSLARAVYDHVKRSAADVDVVYAEVRRDRTLREVLTGLSFHLRKRGGAGPRDAAMRSGITEEERVREVARALGEVQENTLVLVDLAQGDCDDEFARLLSIFLQAGPLERCTFVIFGQESALRGLTSLERELAGIPVRIEQIGFQFEEFAKLVDHFHGNMARERLWNVYQRAAAGRVAGLFARLAYDLARATSIESMERIVAAPPEQMVPRAQRERIDRLAPALRPAADKLACLFLPFRPTEAMDVFPEDRIKAAIDKLLDLGLLHHHDAERLEMHETVRRSVEDDMPVTRRREAHGALAAWYGQQGKQLAEIHHLDCAGRQEEAHRKAREAFLAGQHAYALMDYVAERRLVTGAELADALLQGTLPEHAYLIPRLLRRLGDAGTGEMLMAGLRAQAGRFDTEYQWAWWMVESILACDPGRLHDLTVFGLKAPRREDGRPSTRRFKYITQGAQRGEARVDARMLAIFDAQDDVMKWELLELLVLDPRREVLQKVLPFVETHKRPREDRGSYVARKGPPILLPLRNREEIIAFLGAIPLPDTNAMLAARSPLLGSLAALVWARRGDLRKACVEVLEGDQDDDITKENALRVLTFLAEPRVAEFADRYRDHTSRIRFAIQFIAAACPFFFDSKVFEHRFLDVRCDVEKRELALAVLRWLDVDSGRLLQCVLESEPHLGDFWKFRFLMECVFRPFEEAVPLLEEALNNCMDERRSMLFAPLVMRLGELPGEPAMSMLLRALAHPSAHVRSFACMALQARRSRRAAAPLKTMLEKEKNSTILQSGMVALVASSPATLDDASSWPHSQNASLWRCILAGRLRAESEASLLVAAATEPGNPWQLRRAAILAANQLPFDLALAHIVEPVMRERSPFTMDKSHALLGHHALCAILELEPDQEQLRILTAFGAARVWSVWFDQFVEDALSRHGTPDGTSTAQWAVDRLLRRNAPPKPEALQRLIDELHVPILHAAVLRGLRLNGRYERIEEIIRAADTEWLLVRACSEYAKGHVVTDDITERLRTLIAQSRFPDSPFAANAVKNFQKRADRPIVLPRDAPKPLPTTLTAADVVTTLGTGKLSGDPPFVLSCQDATELQHLVNLLDPINDYITESVSVEPDISFVAGAVTVGGVEHRRRDNHAQLRSSLRPAVAAANRFDVAIPWHARLLSEGGQYLTSFLEHLGAAGDPDRFYRELAEHGDVIIPQFDDSFRIDPIRKLVDTRLVPYLSRYASVGTDGLLECLCSLAGRIDDPVIDPVLGVLFQRWHGRFDRKSKHPQHDDNIPLWRAFGSLRAHPRFRQIRDYDLRLMELLLIPMRWFNKDDLVRILLDCPRSYARLETMLFKSASFEHWYEDEVDRLDAAADALFTQVQDV